MRRWKEALVVAAATLAALAACIDDVKVTERGSGTGGHGTGGHGTGGHGTGGHGTGGHGTGGKGAGCAAGQRACPLGAACAKTEDCIAGTCTDARCQPPGQGSWDTHSEAAPPSPRAYAAMAYDPGSKRVVLFGGEAASATPLDDTWALTAQGWSQTSVSGAPPPARFAAVLAYDTKAAQMVLYGGGSFSASSMPLVLDDTWTFAGGAWTPVATGTPKGRKLAAAAWDSDGQRLVMFGGTDDQFFLAEMWSYQDKVWAPLSAGTQPSEPIGPAMAYDQARRKLVLFGGNALTIDNGGAERTWTFDGAWKDVSPDLGPPRRTRAQAVYDARRRRVVLYGGSHLGFTRSDTWEWDGVAWTRTSAASGFAVVGCSLVYDDSLGRVLAFGGASGENGTPTNALWEYHGWANACASDAACDTPFHCVDGLCCQQSMCAVGEACNVPANPGTCTPVATP